MYTPSFPSLLYPFHLLACGHFYTGKKYFVERDSLQGYLIILTLSGSGFLKYAGKSFTLKTGQIFLINCNEYHKYYSLCDEWEIKWLRFSGPASESYFNQIQTKSFEIFTMEDIYLINEEFEEIIKTSQNPCSTTDMKLSTMIACMLTKLCEKKLELCWQIQNNQSKLIVEKAIEFFKKEYAENISLEDVCKHLHISTFYFSRIFKKHTGISPYSYITKIRINHSKELLIRTDLSVGDIAFQVGFENVNTFIRSFKLFTETTPLKYRKTWAE